MLKQIKWCQIHCSCNVMFWPCRQINSPVMILLYTFKKHYVHCIWMAAAKADTYRRVSCSILCCLKRTSNFLITTKHKETCIKHMFNFGTCLLLHYLNTNPFYRDYYYCIVKQLKLSEVDMHDWNFRIKIRLQRDAHNDRNSHIITNHIWCTNARVSGTTSHFSLLVLLLALQLVQWENR